MPKKAIIETIIESFEDKTVVLSEEQQKYRERILKVLDLKLEDLYITDYDLFKAMKKAYPFITFPQICNDISIAERIIANEKDPGGDAKKAWTRYFITQVTMKAIEKAEAKGDAYTMAYAANILGKHHLTDKEDNVKPNWDDIIPFIPEITSDPSVLGIRRIKDVDKLRAKLEKKYGFNQELSTEIETIEDETED